MFCYLNLNNYICNVINEKQKRYIKNFNKILTY